MYFFDQAYTPTLIASIAYSTWKSRPSGENRFTPLKIKKKSFKF